jgi:transcriptional regulator with XRE-family HTH domain
MPQTPELEALYVSVGEAIRAVRGTRSQDDLAEAIGKNQRTLSAYESGRVATPLHLVPLIEDFCGARRGTIFKRSGLVEDDTSVEAAIEADPALTERKRGMVESYYVFIRDEYDEARLPR